MSGPLRVLLVEDSADDAELVERELRRAWDSLEVERVQDAAALERALDESSWDLVLSDFSIPGFGGRTALDIVRRRTRDLPFIFVSGTIGEDAAVDAMRAGANDYVMKGDLRRLVPAIRRELEEAQSRRDRERAREALRQAEQRFAKIFRASPVGIAVSTLAEGRYLDANEALLSLLGYRREELLGRTVTELRVWPEMADRNRFVEELRKSGAIRNLDVDLRSKSGELRATLCNFEQIEMDGEQCLLSLVLDVSERRRLAEQLRQAQRLEAIGRLAGGIAHDFNNLLTVILGFCDILARDLGRPSTEVEQIRRAADGAATLTRQLLAFSRKQVLHPRLIDLSEVVTRIQRMLERVLGEHVELSSRLAPPEAAVVRADPGQLEQVIVNLVVNARDAMVSGGRLTVATTVRDLSAGAAELPSDGVPGRFVVLSVADTGSGMDEETLSHLFEPFFTTKEAGKGTGLGLATVYGVVAQSRGFVRVASELGKGSTFEVYLPWLEGKPESLEPARVGSRPDGGDETVLLVEDSEPVRLLTRELLEAGGYRVLEAPDGESAIAIADRYEDTIHLLMTDLVLPGTSGVSLARRMVELRPDIKVLYSSGYASDSVLREGTLEGEVHFLEKPFTRSALAAKVREALDAA